LIGDTIVIPINAVNKTLKKINQDSYGADYFLREATVEYACSIRHTIPKNTGTIESHMVRLDVTDIVAGVKSPPMSVWLSFRTDGAFDTTLFGYRIAGLVDFLDNSTLIGQLIGRES
jgi:hypothetical protein